MFPRVYNLQGNATMYILERLQYVTLFKTLSTYIPIPIESITAVSQVAITFYME